MSAEQEFAEALSRALGPLYRVSVAGADGSMEATFGVLSGDRTARAEIPLPRSRRSLVVEIDLGALDTADRMLHALAGASSLSPGSVGGLTHLDQALEHLIAQAEAAAGRPIADMSRAEKQQVVRFLDERGAFAMRKAVETVADALSVSRFTVYNYLDSVRQP